MPAFNARFRIFSLSPVKIVQRSFIALPHRYRFTSADHSVVGPKWLGFIISRLCKAFLLFFTFSLTSARRQVIVVHASKVLDLIPEFPLRALVLLAVSWQPTTLCCIFFFSKQETPFSFFANISHPFCPFFSLYRESWLFFHFRVLWTLFDCQRRGFFS